MALTLGTPGFASISPTGISLHFSCSWLQNGTLTGNPDQRPTDNPILLFFTTLHRPIILCLFPETLMTSNGAPSRTPRNKVCGSRSVRPGVTHLECRRIWTVPDLPVVDHRPGVGWHIDADATGRKSENTPPLRPLLFIDVPLMFHYPSTPLSSCFRQRPSLGTYIPFHRLALRRFPDGRAGRRDKKGRTFAYHHYLQILFYPPTCQYQTGTLADGSLRMHQENLGGVIIFYP